MKFTVALAQIAPALGDLARNVKLYKAAVEQARRGGANLIVFPELSLTGYFLKDMVPDVAQRLDSAVMKDLCKLSREISIVVGFVEESDDFRFFNAAAYLEDGKIVHVHRKVYLPTYGMFDEQRYFATGDRVRGFDSKYGRMGLLVCEDAWHLTCGCLLCLDKVEYVIAISSSPGRGMSTAGKLGTADTWERLNWSYAKFFGVYLIYANRGGFEDGVNFWGGSEVVSPGGEVVARGAYLKEDLVLAAVDSEVIRRERIGSPMLRDERIDVTLDEMKRIKAARVNEAM